MRTTLSALVLLVACNTAGGDDYAVTPGGGSNPSGGGGGSGAGDGGTDGASTITARACVLTDTRNLTSCASTGATNLQVTLDGTSLGVGSPDGVFTIAAPKTAGAVWTISGATIATSYMTYDPAHLTIPVITSAKLVAMTPTGVDLANLGSIMAAVTRTGAPLANATATTTPVAMYPTRYDGATDTTWQPDATGALATLWIPGQPSGSNVTLNVTPQGSPVVHVDGLAVHVGAITFTFVALP